MSPFHRLLKLHQLLKDRRVPLSARALAERLDTDEQGVKRAIRELREEVGAPIVYDRAQRGYWYDAKVRALYELPGLWMDAAELYALLASYQLLGSIQPGVMDAAIAPLRSRIERVLEARSLAADELVRRVRILQRMPRATPPGAFRAVCEALMQRRQLRVLYHGRERDETTERALSPQRLVYYGDNWYLDAWCHLRDGVRTFALDRLQIVEQIEEAAREVDATALDAALTGSYGLFAGTPDAVAVLRFSGDAARWVADEQWHPDQRARIDAGGRLLLEVPYRDPRELIGDILRWAGDVEVLAPEELREAFVARLRSALSANTD